MHGADNFLCRAFYFNNLKGGDFMELNIAVVDDNAASISEVISMMRRFMHEVENITINISKFGSGEKFFKDFSKNAFHAVFLDICMDDMNGIELSRHLRSVDKNIAIIFMSTTTEFVFQTFQATPFGYLIKPFSFEQFAEIMNKTVKFFSENNKNISIRISRMVCLHYLHILQVFQYLLLFLQYEHLHKKHINMHHYQKYFHKNFSYGNNAGA